MDKMKVVYGKTIKQKRIMNDISKITKAIETGDMKIMKDCHLEIEGIYSSYIPNFGQSMYNYSRALGFYYDQFNKASLIHNLTLMKAKLDGFAYNFQQIASSTSPQNNVNVNVEQNNTNEINITMTFDIARQTIEDMPGLNEKETEEIKTKIDELEAIAKEDITKKKKWDKVIPILKFVLDKSADVAVAIMTLIIQQKIGL